MRVKQSVRIQASPEIIFTFLMDIDKRPDYIPALEDIKLLDPLPIRVGSRYTEISTIAGRRMETTYQIMEVKEYKSITSRTVKSIFPIEARLNLYSEDTYVILSVNIEFKLVGLFALASGIIRGIVNQQAKEILSRIKNNIENELL